MKIKNFKSTLIVFTVMIILPGVIYPFMMAGIAHFVFNKKANGSLIDIDGHIAGSALVGQRFSGPEYFQGRPSASDYNALLSGGSNYGPTNKKYIDIIKKRVWVIREENHLPPDTEIPGDIALASGSGLDPHISVESAMIQAKRIATERKISESAVSKIITDNVEKRYFNIFGDSYVNVLKINIALYLLEKKDDRRF
jgi:potassium-transporting ATPase KdpC subunit